MNINPHLSFENTAIDFASKSIQELRKTYLLFSAMNRPCLVSIGTWVTTWALKLRLPVKRLIKRTLFNHCCGGESILDARKTIDKLAESKIFTIPSGSIIRIWHSFSATGLCSIPFGITYKSPLFNMISPSLKRIFNCPSTTKKASSVSGWLCQINSPSTFAIFNW